MIDCIAVYKHETEFDVDRYVIKYCDKVLQRLHTTHYHSYLHTVAQ